MTCYVSSVMLNPTHSVTHFSWQLSNFMTLPRFSMQVASLQSWVVNVHISNSLCYVFSRLAGAEQLLSWVVTIAVYMSEHIITAVWTAVTWPCPSLLRRGNILWQPRHVHDVT